MIKQNGFFAHPELLLLAISQDDKKNISEFGFRRFLKVRQIDARRKTIKTVMPPKINVSVEEYLDIINLINCELPSLPFSAGISEYEMKSQIGSDLIPDWNVTFKQISVYMQAVQHQVKLVTELPGKVCGDESRD